MSNGVIYTRTSKDERKNPRLSNSTQEQVCREKAEEYGDTIVKVYSDIDRSGDSEKLKRRKQFLKMIKEVKDLKAERVWFLDLSRFSRSNWQQEMFIYELKKVGIDFMPINDSKEKMMRQVKGIMNENLIDASRDRTESEHSARLKMNHPVSRPPRGYKCNFRRDAKNPEIKIPIDKSKETWRWIIDDKEAEKIKKIFGLKINGKNEKEISQEMGIILPTVRHILSNKAYLGIYSYRNISFKGHEPIITEEVFNKCQNIN